MIYQRHERSERRGQLDGTGLTWAIRVQSIPGDQVRFSSHRFVAAVLITTSFFACDGADSNQSAARELFPISDSTQPSVNSVASTLLTRQLALLQALTSGNGRAGVYLTQEFKLFDYRSQADAEELDYFQALVRPYEPAELESEQHEIRELHEGAGVVITHTKQGHPILTRWEATEGEWKAVLMIIDPPRHILDLAQVRSK